MKSQFIMPEKVLDKKEIQRRLNSIRIKPEGLQPRKYGVSVKYFDGDNEKPTKRIDYKVIAEVKIEHGIGAISINKEEVFFNQAEPDRFHEILVAAISRSIYPVKVFYNEKGIASKEIINHKEISERWEKEKSAILEKYNSKSLDDFIQIAEEKLQNKDRLEKSLHYDCLWNLFFHPILMNYGERRSVENYLYLPIIPYQSPLRFHGIQTIEKIPTDYHSFKVNFESNELPAPKYFYPKNSPDDAKYWMSLTVYFDSDVYHHFPMHIRAYFEVYSKDWVGKNVTEKKIQFTMYQIGSEEYNGKTLSKDSPFISGGLVKLPPNKWGFDNFEKIENDW